MKRPFRFVGFGLILAVFALGLVFVPAFAPGSDEIELIPESEPSRPTEQKTVRLYVDQLQPSVVGNSKALAMLGGDPTVDGYVWGNGGDGSIVSDGSHWIMGSTTASIYHWYGGIYYDACFSFNIGDTFVADNAKSIDLIIFNARVYASNNEGSEILRIKAFETNAKSGQGGDPPANYAEAIARNGDWAVPRKSGQTDTTTFNTVGWRWVGVPTAWIAVGDTGYLTLYLLAASGWESNPYDWITFYTKESGGNQPYLEITYTAWSAPTANSADIVGEPSELLPGQSYSINTTISDADGRDNLENAYLYISADHTTNRVRFDWDIDTGTFSQGEGATYVVLNTTACANETSGATGWKITWGFSVTVNWQEGYMDYANSATDSQSKTTTNWNNENSWHTDRLWVHSITAEWISESVNLEDGDYVYTSEALNITGYVYWYDTLTVYDLGFGTPIAKLYIDGADQGSSYNCSLDASGYYNISYTTPATEDWDWSVDIQLGSLPSGMTEGPSNDNGKNPLFLIAVVSAAFGESGASVSIATAPATIIPNNIIEQKDLEWRGGFRMLEANDGQVYLGYTNAPYYFIIFEFSSRYWAYVDALSYDFSAALDGTSDAIAIYDYHPARTTIATQTADNPSLTGTHSVTSTNWIDGRMQVEFEATGGGSGWAEFYIDQATLNFTSFSEDQVANRILNDTTVLDVITLDSKAWNTTFTITGIPMTYSYSYMTPGLADYTDEISSLGKLTLTNTSVGQYYIYLDTGLTWHEVAFSPTLPDGLSIDWQVFEWYCNETHLNRMPYPLSHGFYYLLVKDAYDNTIVSTNFTILSTDVKDLIYGIGTLGVIPLYKLTIPNEDNIAYSIDLTRNDKTYPFPLSPNSETEGIRVYGIESGANYTLTIWETDGINRYFRAEYSLAMPNHGYVYDAIDLLSNDMDIVISRFWFDRVHWYIMVDTQSGGATVDVYEDDVLIFDDYSEDTDFIYAKDTTRGQHTVDFIVSKTGYEDRTYNSTYYTLDQTLYIMELIPPMQTAEGNISMMIQTNWGNCTLTIDEFTWDPSTNNWQTTAKNVYASVSEGSVSWAADFSAISVKVGVLINGSSQTLSRTFYYSKAYQDVNVAVGSTPPIVIEAAADIGYWTNTKLAFVIVGGLGILGFLIEMTRREKIRIPGRRKKPKGSRDATKLMEDSHKKMTDPYTRF